MQEESIESLSFQKESIESQSIAQHYSFFITDEHHVQSIDYIKCQECLFKLTPAQRAEQYFFSHTRVETLPV